MEIVVGIPAYNEEKNIARIIVELQNVTDKIIVCNDGSMDMTSKIAEKMGVYVINHPKNLGYGAAIRNIFLKAKELNADILVTLDADGQHRVEDVQTVMEPIIKKEAEIVIGSRFLSKDYSMPSYRKLGIKTITKISNVATKKKLTDSQSGFRAYNKRAILELAPSDYGMGVSTEILIKADRKGFKIVEVPIKILYEGDTSTHNPIGHGTSVVFSTMKFISIEHPLKFYGIPGIIFIGIGIFFTMWTVQEYSQFGRFPLNLGLTGIGSAIFGTMLAMTAILLYTLVDVVREGKNG